MSHRPYGSRNGRAADGSFSSIGGGMGGGGGGGICELLSVDDLRVDRSKSSLNMDDDTDIRPRVVNASCFGAATVADAVDDLPLPGTSCWLSNDCSA